MAVAFKFTWNILMTIVVMNMARRLWMLTVKLAKLVKNRWL